MERNERGHSVWVFRTPSQKWDRKIINPKQKDTRVSQIVWTCFAGVEKGPCVDLIGDLDSKRGGGCWKGILENIEELSARVLLR